MQIHTGPRRASILISAIAIARGLVAPAALGAQSMFGFGGLEARAGMAAPRHGTAGPATTFEADLGYLGVPQLRTALGFDLFSATVDRNMEIGGVTASMRGTGAVASLRYDWFPRGTATLHLLFGATAHSVQATSASRVLEDELGGGHLGAQFGAGITVWLGSNRYWSLTADIRQVTEQYVGRTVIAGGLRYSMRGRRMYERDDIPHARPVLINPE
jgi:hypothetical protein